MKHWASSLYGVHLLVSDAAEEPLHRWPYWQKAFDTLDGVLALSKETAAIRSMQSLPRSSKWLPFGRMVWNRKNNEKWTTKYLADASLSAELSSTEIWSPDWNAVARKEKAPDFYIRLEDLRYWGVAQALTVATIEPLYTNNTVYLREAIDRLLSLMPGARSYFGRLTWAEKVHEYGFSNAIQDRGALRLVKQLVQVAA